MIAGDWDRLPLRGLAAMPFLDRLELAAVTGMSEGTAHNVLGRLHLDGLADCIRHTAPLTPSTRRWRLTVDGVGRLAVDAGTGVESILRTSPVSARWQRVLLARLDAVAVIYRLASAVANAGGPPRFRWYRGAVLDAAIMLPDGRSSWRTWPHRKLRRKVPMVEGALTVPPRVRAVPSVRNTSASSIQSPPASADATRVIILSPVLARPGALPRSRHCWTSWGRPRRRARVAGRISPALATRRVSSKAIRMRSGWWRGSFYWVLLFWGGFRVSKPLSQMRRSTFLMP